MAKKIDWRGIELFWQANREFTSKSADSNAIRAMITVKPDGVEWLARMTCFGKDSEWARGRTVHEAIDNAAKDIIAVGEKLKKLLAEVVN